MPKQERLGTQADTYSNTSNMKPVEPTYEGGHYADSPYEEPFNLRWDRFNNELNNIRPSHETATAGEGTFGNRQHSSNSADIQSTGYGSNYGLNEIPYATGSAFDRGDSVTVDVSRADRGKDS
jgi:hypothetical protein